MLTYRAEPGLEARQAQHLTPVPGGRGETRIAGYLEHLGDGLRARFEAAPYLALLDAMDSHDLVHARPLLSRIRDAKALVVDLDTDMLFTPSEVRRLADLLEAGGTPTERATIRSAHGHDAFLIEWPQLDAVVRRALML
jgi:homoserine O-acetyltransferase